MEVQVAILVIIPSSFTNAKFINNGFLEPLGKSVEMFVDKIPNLRTFKVNTNTCKYKQPLVPSNASACSKEKIPVGALSNITYMSDLHPHSLVDVGAI